MSLNLHIKIKHNGGTKKEREEYAVLSLLSQKMVIDAEERGAKAPHVPIDFPPNFLQVNDDLRRNFGLPTAI